MDAFRELRRRERAQAALQRIYVESGQQWTGTGAQTKRTRTSQTMDSFSSSTESDTRNPANTSSMETGKGRSAATTVL